MTVRSEGQFNTVVYEEEDIYRGQDRRDVILMNRGRHRPARPDGRSARDGAQRRRRDARHPGAGVRHPRRQRADVLSRRRTCWCRRRSIPQSKTPAFKTVLGDAHTRGAGRRHAAASGAELACRRAGRSATPFPRSEAPLGTHCLAGSACAAPDVALLKRREAGPRLHGVPRRNLGTRKARTTNLATPPPVSSHASARARGCGG